jgi:hypothetical protein
LLLSHPEVLSMRLSAMDEDRWITTKKKSEEGHGRHIKIDEHGNIVGGAVPKSAQGKPVGSWWKTEEPKNYKATIKAKNGKEYTVEGGKLKGPNGRELSATEYKEISQAPAPVRAAVKKAGISPQDYVYIGGTAAPREVAEEIVKQNKSIENDKQQKMDKNVPGLKTLQKAIAEQEEYSYKKRAAFEKGMETGVYKPLKVPETNIKELQSRYPAATAWIRADNFARSSNADKYSAGEKARKAIENGENYESAIKRMEKEWSDAAIKSSEWN